MAVSNVQPLLLLLALLFFLPFSRAVDFEYCNGNGYDINNVTGLKISPNTVKPLDAFVTISLSLSTNTIIKSIRPTATLVVYHIFHGMRVPVQPMMGSLVCTAGLCPLEPSKNYDLNVTIFNEYGFPSRKYLVSLDDRAGYFADREKLCVTFDLPT